MAIFFKPHETMCRCGCGLQIESSVLETIDRIRSMYGKPMNITSGARCLSYNESIGSKDTSPHPKGLAIDTAAPTHNDKAKLVQWGITYGAKGIGIYPIRNFIHLDWMDRGVKYPVVWYKD